MYHHKKISLIAFGFLCCFQVLLLNYFWHYLHDPIERKTVLRFNLPSNDENNRFGGKAVKRMIQNKKMVFINLPEAGSDGGTMKVIRSHTVLLTYNRDTSSVINVHFTGNNTYGQFTYLVNMMTEEGMQRYIWYRDKFYILGNKWDEY